MNFKTAIYSVLILILGACNPDETQTLALSNPQISSDGAVLLKWNTTNLTGFKHYSVLRSTNGQTYSTINDITTPGAESFNIDSTSYLDDSYPVSSQSIYYKVMAFGDKVISSEGKLAQVPTAFQLSGSINTIPLILGKERRVLFYDASSYKMNLYDFDQQRIIKSTTFQTTYYNSIIGYGKYNGKYEFYYYDGQNYALKIYDALTMSQTASVTISNSSIDKIICDNSGNIFAYDTYSSWIYRIDRKTMTSKNINLNNSYYYYDINYNSYSNKFCGMYSNRLDILTNDTTTFNVVASKTINTNSSTFICLENTNLIYYSTSNGGRIINTDTWEENALLDANNQIKTFNSMCAADGVIYANYQYENKVYCYSATTLKLIKTINLKLSPNFIATDGDYLIYIGNNNGYYYLCRKKVK